MNKIQVLDSPVTKIIKNQVDNGLKKSENLTESAKSVIKKFDDITGEVLGRSQVKCKDKATDLKAQQWERLKEDLKEQMAKEGYSESFINKVMMRTYKL
jgi:hypothetical protein